MDPLQQPALEVPAVAETLQQQPLANPQVPEETQPFVPSEQPVKKPVEQAVEQDTEQATEPIAQPIDQHVQQSVPVSVNVQAPAPEQPAPRAGFDNGYNSDSKAHYHSRSTDFHQSAPEYNPREADASSRLNSSPSLNQQPQLHTASRPGSGFSSGPERHSLSQPQPSDPTQRQPNQSKNSVVIKVGMVGDAQIGKTSLMVKYVEGSWDEDYIQTLGMLDWAFSFDFANRRSLRCQLYGKDHLYSQHRNHIFHLGSGWSTRVCEHAASCV